MKDKLTGRFEITHDSSRTCEYAIWGNILYRCNTSTAQSYPSYGGRGIKVCARWSKFELFIADMGRRPSSDHSIDRVDVNGDYSKDNCRWTTAKEQARNRRNSRYIYVGEDRLQVDEYCEKYNISKSAIKNRIRRGWSNDRIINTPVRGA